MTRGKHNLASENLKIKISKPFLLFAIFSLFTASSALALLTTDGDFSDLPSSHSNYTAIMSLKNRGILEGYPDGTFKPDQPVNRVEALKIIILGSGIGVPPVFGTAGFSDTGAKEWYAPMLNRAVDLKIVQGYPDGSFKPSQTVNLVENLKMLLNTNNVDVSSLNVTENPYADAFADQWYVKYVEYSREKNLIDADAKNKILPGQGMTRGKLAEAMYRFLYIQENGLSMFEKPQPEDSQEALSSEQTPTQQTESTQQTQQEEQTLQNTNSTQQAQSSQQGSTGAGTQQSASGQTPTGITQQSASGQTPTGTSQQSGQGQIQQTQQSSSGQSSGTGTQQSVSGTGQTSGNGTQPGSSNQYFSFTQQLPPATPWYLPTNPTYNYTNQFQIPTQQPLPPYAGGNTINYPSNNLNGGGYYYLVPKVENTSAPVIFIFVTDPAYLDYVENVLLKGFTAR